MSSFKFFDLLRTQRVPEPEIQEKPIQENNQNMDNNEDESSNSIAPSEIDLINITEDDYLSEDSNMEGFDIRRKSVITLLIRSKIPGVIPGGQTIPLMTSAQKRWKKILRKGGIKMNREKHVMTGHGQRIEDINSSVYTAYFKYFKKARQTYLLDIVSREEQQSPPPKPKAKRAKKRAQKKRPASTRVKKVSPKAKAAIATPPRKKARRSTRQKKAAIVSVPVPVPVSVPVPNPPPVPVSVQAPQIPNPPPPVVQQPPVQPNPLPLITGQLNALIQRSGPVPIPAPVPAMPPPQVPGQIPPQVPGQVPPQVPCPVNLDLFGRDESTQGGERIAEGEEEVKTKILTTLLTHHSNRDMLVMKQELLNLKKNRKFQALVRLAPFTSGLLQNAVIDDHPIDL